MADNITTTAGVIASDEVTLGGVVVQVPRNKLGFGSDGTYTEVSPAAPLPVAVTGGSDASAANQATEIARLSAIVSALTGVLQVTAAALPLPAGAATDTKSEAIRALLAGTLAVSAQALPLPAGAATAGNQATGNVSLAAIVSAITGTLAVSAQALPLPVGAATDAKLDLVRALLAGLPTGTEVYQLADGSAGLTAGASTNPVTVARGGYYFFDASFGGTSPSLKLQRLGADAATWIDVVTRTAVGSGDPIGVPSGSQLRLTNAGTNALTNVAGRLG